MPHWTDEDTHLALPRSGTPRDVDGYKLGEPTGEVVCEHCYRSAWHLDWIDHADDCPLAGDD
jgi:hypothetical protein